MDYENLLTERRGDVDGILWVTLNRPQKLNALSMDTFAELEDVFRSVRKDRSVRCVVITGAGRGFCAGADFSGGGGGSAGQAEIDLEGARLNFHRESDAYVALKNVEVPIIASINGVLRGRRAGHGLPLRHGRRLNGGALPGGVRAARDLR